MNFTTLFGLPAHPLLVHIPVVFLPVSALGILAIAFSASLRRRFGWLVVATTAIAFVGTLLAADSGDALERSVDKSPALTTHTQLAEQLRPLAGVLLAAVLGLMLGGHLLRNRKPLFINLIGAVCVVLAAANAVWVIRVAHNGAKAAWQDTHIVPEQGKGR